MNCYILCGGKSSRMGRPKQGLEVGGRTFLEITHHEASSVFERVIAVTKEGMDAAGFPVIHERETELTAPILGLARASEDAGDAPFFALAVDYPLMSAQLLRFLRERLEASSAEIVAPRVEGKVHVLCAGYRPRVRVSIEDKVRRGDFRLQGLIDLHEADIIESDELGGLAKALLNVNTIEDFERARVTHGETGQA
jgi:molybdopterin-guanine dinucleotide biosynthesis protein A